MRRVEYGTGRQEVLEAAIHVVATQGLRGLTFRSVAAEAGVTHGAVQYHFGGWDNLVAEALGFAVKRSIDTAGLKPAGPGFADFAGALSPPSPPIPNSRRSSSSSRSRPGADRNCCRPSPRATTPTGAPFMRRSPRAG